MVLYSCLFGSGRARLACGRGEAACTKLVIWHACCLHFATSEDHQAIQVHLGWQKSYYNQLAATQGASG